MWFDQKGKGTSGPKFNEIHFHNFYDFIHILDAIQSTCFVVIWNKYVYSFFFIELNQSILSECDGIVEFVMHFSFIDICIVTIKHTIICKL